MKIFLFSLCLTLILLVSSLLIYAQDSTQECKVLLQTISLQYKGDCKKGLANGKGEARGVHHYIGSFKNGLPNDKGTYYYSDYIFYTGNFQDGIKEGKGEMHYVRNNMADSIIKGYWSADEYRGKSYVTYITDVVPKFDRVDISSTPQSGNRISLEISTTSNSPDGQLYAAKGDHLFLTELISVRNNSLIKLLSSTESPLKSTWVFEITQFPITLRGSLSNGQIFNVELYKSANWTFRLFLNK